VKQGKKTTTKRKPQKLPLVLGRDEVKAMVNACTLSKTGLRMRGLIAAMGAAGLRCDEATALRPCNVRWKEAIIEVKRGKGAKDRNVPIEPEDLAVLKAWDDVRPQGARTFFCTHKGGRLNNRYVRCAVKRAAVRAGLDRAEEVHPHSLRHSYATTLLEDGYTIAEVQDRLGHEDLATTKIYLKVRPGRRNGPPICADREPAQPAPPTAVDPMALWATLDEAARAAVVQFVGALAKGTKLTT